MSLYFHQILWLNLIIFAWKLCSHGNIQRGVTSGKSIQTGHVTDWKEIKGSRSHSSFTLAQHESESESEIVS